MINKVKIQMILKILKNNNKKYLYQIKMMVNQKMHAQRRIKNKQTINLHQFFRNNNLQIRNKYLKENFQVMPKKKKRCSEEAKG